MTTFAQRSSTSRRPGLAAASGVVSVVATLVAVAAASPTATTTIDCANSNLQTAIDSAGAGAKLAVTGTCLGNFTISKDLTLLARGTAVLDGQQGGTTLTV